MIRFGPAGIPLSCKGRTIRDGIEDIHALGLHCMEIQLVRGKYVDEQDDFEELGGIAHSLDIHMAIHAPYYMDFLGIGYMRNKSTKFLEFAGEVGNKIGARKVVTHMGPYHNISSREAIERLVPIFREIRNHYLTNNYSPQIGIEISGKPDLFGVPLVSSQEDIADELASAASLVQGQADEGKPVALIRGIEMRDEESSAKFLIRSKELDLFR